MKKIALLIVFFGLTSISQAEWNLDGQTIWSRESGKASLERKDGVYRIEHSGDRDWAVVLHKNIPVKPGEVYRISGTVQAEGGGSIALTIGIFDADGKVIDWSRANALQRETREKKHVADQCVIPRGAATILPRIVGSGNVKAEVFDIKLEKLDEVVLLDPVVEVPKAGEGFLDLLPKDGNFSKSLEFKGPAFSDKRYRTPSVSRDHGNTDGEEPTWRIAALDGLAFELLPLEPIKAEPGDRFLVSLRINLERGNPELLIFPWSGGSRGKTSFASGTFRPHVGEEGGKWCTVHAYITVPEKVEGFVPAIVGADGGVFNISRWTLSRPTDAELNPVRKKVEGDAETRRWEALDRGLVAVRTDKGVYLSWRLLQTDGPDTAFNIYRHDPDGEETKLNTEPVTRTTDFLDENAPQEGKYSGKHREKYRWSVRVSVEGQRTRILPVAYQSDEVEALDTPYVSIKLKDEKSFASIAFADLDGDGRLDYVVKTPNANIDPYYMYWKKSPGTYKLQAYKSDGTFLWEYELGWGIEQGIWYSPYLVADLDGDGCAEIAVKTCPGDFRDPNGRVYDGPEHLSILDGKTGKERLKIDWPERDGLPYNLSSRHQLCLAYLDGKTPCLIVLRGTYSRMVAVAYKMLTEPEDGLEELWRWDNRWEREQGRWGQGAHTTHAYDVDGDGRDEIILGSIVLDDDGSVLWELKLGHPDHVYLGDIDPERPGLEIVYGIESRQREKNGVCMVDAGTGEILWGHDKPTIHVHSTGMVSDIDFRHPGCEIWSGEQDSVEDRWLRDATGNILEIPEKFPVRDLAPKSAWWDGGLQRKMIVGNRPVEFPSFEPIGEFRFGGSIRRVGDVLGDWREEVITSGEGEIRIYTTTIPAKDRRTTFLQDRNYRATMIESTMGYPQIPLPTENLKTE